MLRKPTIAHFNHDPRDNRDENLQALCQWCHFHHDQRFHVFTARAWREEGRASAAPPGGIMRARE